MTNKIKDLIGNTLEVGDIVAVTIPNFSELQRCEVVKINPKSVRVKYKPPRWKGEYAETTRYPNQIIKITKAK